jgi:hypothetical protein
MVTLFLGGGCWRLLAFATMLMLPHKGMQYAHAGTH